MADYKDIAVHDANGELIAMKRKVYSNWVRYEIGKLLQEHSLLGAWDKPYSVDVRDHEPDDVPPGERYFQVRVGYTEHIYIERDVLVQAATEAEARAKALDSEAWRDQGNELCNEVLDSNIDLKVADEPVRHDEDHL